MNPIKIYARPNQDGEIIRFLTTVHGMNEIQETDIFVAEGFGDMFAYPELSYPLISASGDLNWKVSEDGNGIELVNIGLSRT